MVRKTKKPKEKEDASLPDPEPVTKKKRKGDSGLIFKLVMLLTVVGIAVGAGAYFHKKQNEQPLGYEYFKKRGYDKIKTLGPPPEEPPKSSLEEDLEDAKVKAQRNIFLQD